MNELEEVTHWDSIKQLLERRQAPQRAQTGPRCQCSVPAIGRDVQLVVFPPFAGLFVHLGGDGPVVRALQDDL